MLISTLQKEAFTFRQTTSRAVGMCECAQLVLLLVFT
jgi:hypothetical protein